MISRFSHGTFKEGFIQLKALQADIVACAIDGSENCHIMGALPTGYGKSLPMLVTGLLMPPGIYVNLRTRLLLLFKIGLGNLTQVTRTLFIMFKSCSTIGSTVLVITALTAIAQQLMSDCQLYKINALSSNQASEIFKD